MHLNTRFYCFTFPESVLQGQGSQWSAGGFHHPSPPHYPMVTTQAPAPPSIQQHESAFHAAQGKYLRAF